MLPFIKTPHCLIRVPELSDAPLMQAAIKNNHQNLKQWMPWAQQVASIKDTEHFLHQVINTWRSDMIPHVEQSLVIMDTNNKNFIGATGVKLLNPDVPSFEIGYWGNIKHAGRGLMTEAVNGLAHYLFTVSKTHRLEIHSESGNTKSINLAKRLNFTQEATLKNHRVTADRKNLADTELFVATDLKQLNPLTVNW